MFVLDKKEISGYKFLQKTWYAAKHCGVDYRASGATVRAPFNGEIISESYGLEGGNTIHFYAPERNITVRLMHLKQFLKGKGLVLMGEPLAITDSTGALCFGEHLHLDVQTGKHYAGDKSFSNIANFQDPEIVDWGTHGAAIVDTVVAPAPPPPPQSSGFPRTMTATTNVYVRSQPNRNAPLAGSKKLLKGDKFTAVGQVTGENVDGNDQWVQSKFGNYIWSGGLA